MSVIHAPTTTQRAAPATEAPKLRREVGTVGLMFTSVGSIIGSGWLFGALTASAIAGPAALRSWVLGGGMILLALIHAELGGSYPVAGGSARFPVGVRWLATAVVAVVIYAVAIRCRLGDQESRQAIEAFEAEAEAEEEALGAPAEA